MLNVVIEKVSKKIVYRQVPKFNKGNGIKSACILYGFKPEELEEVSLTKEKYDDALFEETKPARDKMEAMEVIRAKHHGKKKSDLTTGDIEEYMSLKMVEELGLEI